VSSFVADTSRRLPRGWAHLGFQFVIWMGFYVVYQVARGAADRSVASAFSNGEWVLRQERGLGALFEPAVQRVVDTSSIMVTLTSYTYWLSQFAVVGATLLWVYFRHHEKFSGFRNWLITANLVGLIGYILMPTAPPRMFPEWGFVAGYPILIRAWARSGPPFGSCLSTPRPPHLGRDPFRGE